MIMSKTDSAFEYVSMSKICGRANEFTSRTFVQHVLTLFNLLLPLTSTSTGCELGFESSLRPVSKELICAEPESHSG